MRRTFANVAALAVPTIADWCVIFLRDGEAIVPVALSHRDPAQTPVLERIYRAHPVADDGPLAETIRSGSPLLRPVIDAGNLNVRERPRQVELQRCVGARSSIFVPLNARGHIFGAIALVRSATDHPYDESDLQLALLLARRAAVAVDNARLFARERQVANVLQQASFPKAFPVVPGLAFDAVYAPGRAEAEIGGDWYDAFALPDGRVVVSVGDISGSGLEAAATMGKVRQAIRSAAMSDPDPTAILRVADAVLRLDDPERMATAVVGLIDPFSRTLLCASAGHPGPLVARGNGEIDELTGCGLPLGLLSIDDARPTRSVALDPGALLVFYTDGLVESTRDIAEGERRLRVALANDALRRSQRPARTIYDRVLYDGARDDVAILTVAVAPEGDDREGDPAADAASRGAVSGGSDRPTWASAEPR